MNPQLDLQGRLVGLDHQPLVIAEIGINHEGDLEKAFAMIDMAAEAGCESVKFQSHAIDQEMCPTPSDPRLSEIRDTIARCSFSTEQEKALKNYTDKKGLIFLSTPFSSWSADRLNDLDVCAFKIGSGECNNIPLISHVAQLGKPVLLSTGMNSLPSIARSVAILERNKCPYAIFHCTSIYPTPEETIRLGALTELQSAFPKAVIGLSDHSPTVYPCLGAVSLGASLLERHFTGAKDWPGPDIAVSSTPNEFRTLIEGSQKIHAALGGKKTVLPEEKPTMEFAFATVTATRDLNPGDLLSLENIRAMRPGTGEIAASQFDEVLGKTATEPIKKDQKIKWDQIH